MSLKNPIYTAYYSHDGCLCFKIDLPWSTYNRETLVLCRVSEGIEKARRLAKKALKKHLDEALNEEFNSKD